MAKNGAYHSARSDINNIRNMLLQGQNQKTSLIFILKEIVQNADDCRSQRLSIGLSKGLNKAKHPLLRSPAILVVNDGYFSKKDDKSIRSIGASAKENDSSAVGKFGIGLKTVFLICEAFFYLKGPNADAEVDPGSMLNLWATDDPEDVPKSDWDELDFESSDQNLMAEEREEMGFEDGFTLWFPLRKKDHCQRGEDANPIVEQYPGDDSQFIDEFTDSFLGELAGFIPLLKHLKKIEVYNEKIKNCIQVNAGSVQCLPKFDTFTPQPQFLKGNIEINAKQQQYFGYQQILDNVDLNRLKNGEDWPKLIPDAKGVREKQKAEQHCAVVIFSHPKMGSKGKLKIQWAVFLPTAESPTGNIEEISIEADEDYVLTLHGFFFLGADRRRILAWSKSSNDGVLQQWNKILAEQGTLPLLLPTLENFAQEKSPEIVKELTQKLQNSELWRNYQEFICSKGSWAYVVHFKDNIAESRWKFIEGKTTIYHISDSERLFEVLPYLKSFSINNILTYKNWPFLSQQKTTDIPSSKIAELLRHSYSIAHQICTDQEQVKTLHDFLSKSRDYEEVKQGIQGFIKQALLQNHLDNLAPNFSDLLGMITPRQVLYLPKDCPRNLCIALIKLQEKTSCLIVPASLNHNNSQEKSPQLSVNNARIILHKLSEFAKNNITFTESYALKVISWSNDKSLLIQQIQTLPLFKLQSLGQENQPQLTTLDQLQIYLNQKRLFSNKSQQFVKILSQAIEWEIYVAEPSIGNYLNNLNVSQNLPTCDANNAITLLNQKPPLKPVSERKELLIELLKSLDSRETNKQAIRYLLHEESKQFDSKDTLYAGDSNSSNLYYRVLRHLIGKEKGWRFISSELLNLLSPQQRNWLIIADVNKSSIEQELHKNYNVSSIDWSSFETTDREDLIANLQESLVKKLRIHETIDSSQKLVSIDEHTYLKGDFEINPNLTKELGIVLIRRSQRDDVAYHQEKLIPLLTTKILIEKYLLKCSNPSQYWEHIMDCLKPNPDICSQIDGLSKTVWLPSDSGTPYKPDDIIHLEKIQDDIQRIAANCDRIYITSQELSSDLRNHSGFEEILCKRLFPKRKKALEILGLLLEESQEYRVGDFEETINNQILKDWLTAFKELSIMPVASLLSSFDEIEDALVIFNELKKTLNKDELVKILNALADKNKQSTGDTKKSLWNTFCLYLQQAVKHCQWLEILNSIRLFSQADKWQKADKLCYDAPNIDCSYLLNSELKTIIPEDNPENLRFIEDYQQSSNLNQASDTAVHQEEQNSDKILKNYFENWPHRTKRAIGILLRILSSDKQTETRKLTEQYLPNADAYLEILKLTSIKGNNSSFITETNKKHFDICLNTQKTTEVTSLIGKPLKAELRQEVNSLISGQPAINGNRVELTLQKHSIDDSSKLLELVKESFQYILKKVYDYRVDNPVNFWQEINTLPDIEIVQQKILKSGMINLRNQLKTYQNDCTEILEKIENYSRLDDQLTELARVNTSELKVKDINKELGDIRKEIGQLLINNENSQKAFLKSVKQDIERASYDHQSIPFELFQNADDACWQLYEMGKKAVLDEFVLGFDGKSIWICHWGRRINQDQFGGNDSNKSSYKDDILNMLLLNFSNKTDGVTGKFGLGFKSTFLLSEKPRVVSGSIGFEVVGGIYLRELTTEEFESTKSYLEKDAENGTVILLPDVSRTETEQVVKEFRNCVPLLGAFSKWIKRFTLPNNETWVWDKQSIQGVSNAYYGSSKNGEVSLEGLLLGEHEECCFLQLSPSGVKSLSSDSPTFWVTAPTRMKLDVGFAVNAPFHLDVGRSQLDLRGGGKIKNQEIAKRLGDQLGKALIELYNLSEEELRDHLYLTADTTPLVFWTSVWNVLGVQFAQKNWEDEGIRLLYQMLWGENGGMTQLFQDCDTLPTGLPNIFEAFNGLTRPEKIHWYVKGILDKNSSVLQKVLKWPWCNKIEKSQLVSSEVAKTLEKLTGKQIESLELVTLLKWELRNTEYKLNPERSVLIGNLIRQDFLKELDEPEKSQIIEELIKVKFQAKDQKWYLASQLLVAENNSDESLIVKFAPLSAILDESYESIALDLFHLCRQDKTIDVSELVKWIRQTEGEKRDNALRYLISGERRDKIIECLKSQIPDWIAEIEHPTRQEQLTDRGFKKYQLQNLLHQLGLLQEQYSQYSQQEDVEENTSQITSSNSNGKQPPKSPPKTPEQLLRQIFDWWQDKRDNLIKEYERSIYPNNDWKLTKTNHNLQRSSTTKAWLALLLLGTCHTMGRTNPEQHRDFLNHCERWGWFTAMGNRKIKASDWLDLLDDYFSSIERGERLEYYQWVKHYPAVYAFARWWEIYRDSLLFTNQDSRNYDIDIIFSPRKNNRFLQGSGQGNDAPPLGKILGIGQTFVVRELLRAGILTNSAMHPYAYVPVRRVRGILQAIGCQGIRQGGEDRNEDRNIANSNRIYDFLVKHLGEEDATFFGDYDLPFLMLDKEPDHRKKEILGDIPIISKEPLEDDVEGKFPSQDGDFVTLRNGRVIPRSWMN